MPRVIATVTMTCDPSDLDEVVGIFETFIRNVKTKDRGTLNYSYFLDEDPLRITVFEEYADGAAHVDHYAHLDHTAVGRLLELVTLGEPHYYGEPTDAERELLAGFGDVRFHRLLVSTETVEA